MKLAWVFFDCDIPVMDRYDRSNRFAAKDGWELERTADGLITIGRDGKTMLVWGYGYTCEELPPAPVLAVKPKRKRLKGVA